MDVVKIYLIDDDETFRFLTKDIIASTNIPVKIKEFEYGKKALEQLEKNAKNPDKLPDVIFIDLYMPVMDGWQFLEEYASIINKLQKKIRLYFFSSSISPHDIEKARLLKLITDFIIKPIDDHKFLDIVKNLSM